MSIQEFSRPAQVVRVQSALRQIHIGSVSLPPGCKRLRFSYSACRFCFASQSALLSFSDDGPPISRALFKELPCRDS
jgi:hypothetical protein